LAKELTKKAFSGTVKNISISWETVPKSWAMLQKEQQVKQYLLKEKAELQSHIFAQMVKTQKMVEAVVLDMWKATKKELVEKLRDPNPLIRWFAVDILSRRQIHVEKELIALLNDPFVQVRNAAREALVRLGRGTDFGPSAKASKAEIKQAVARWTEWLAMQDPISPSLNSENRSDLEPFQLIEKKKPPGKSPR
jgi:hypothetical protein